MLRSSSLTGGQPEEVEGLKLTATGGRYTDISVPREIKSLDTYSTTVRKVCN